MSERRHDETPAVREQDWNREVAVARSDELSQALRIALHRVIVQLLDQGRSVWLYRLGILSPHQERTAHSYATRSRRIIQEEVWRELVFEKCDDLTFAPQSLLRESVDLRFVLADLRAALPPALQSVSDRQLRNSVQEIFLDVRREVLEQGVADCLRVGELFSLRCGGNRSGDDPFSQSDLFLVSSHRRLVRSETPRFHEEPVLQNSWEPFEALYGPQALLLNVANLHRFAADIGLDLLPSERELLRHGAVELRVFMSRGKNPALAAVTSGFSTLLPNAPTGSQIECTFEIREREPSSKLTAELAPLVFLAWCAVRTRTLPLQEKGIVVSAEEIESNARCTGASVLVSPDEQFQTPYLLPAAWLHYMRVTGVTADEARAGEAFGAATLRSLLARRGLEQTTVFGRRSVFVGSPLTSSLRIAA